MLDTFKKATPEALAAIREEMGVRRTTEVHLYFPMGSQTDHLIYLAYAKLGVYCLVADPTTVTAEDVRALGPIGITLSGGPASVHAEPPVFDNRIFDLGIPIFGICLGFQMWAGHRGLEVRRGATRELGVHTLWVKRAKGLFAGSESHMVTPVMQSHEDEVVMNDLITLDAMTVTARGQAVVAAASLDHLYGVQFHPEQTETEQGMQMFENFHFGICGAKGRFPAEEAGKQKIAQLCDQLGDTTRVLCLLSGGSDSSTVAHLLRHAGLNKTRLRGIYIRGVDRPDDEAFVRKHFDGQDWIEVVYVDATDRFLEALAGKTSMQEKRATGFKPIYNAIGGEEAERFSEGGTYQVVIAQGTLYTDLSESGQGQGGARKAVIKVHHNTKNEFRSPRTGRLFEEVTPLADCVKDGGRDIGRSIGVPEELLTRHPFPGPGLILRIEGKITREKLAMERQLDNIYIGELRSAGLYYTVWQAGIVITQSEHTLTQGDDAGSGPIIVYWAVWSVNGFTARAAHLPPEFHERLNQRIGNEVRGVGPTAYRYTGKPWGTIEWG